MNRPKEPIRLRKRMTTTGNYSLYLDCYIKGRRTYEYLRLYLTPENSRQDKERNRETLRLAEAIRAKRIIELHNGEYGFRQDIMTDIRFFDYYRTLLVSAGNNSTKGLWQSCLNYLLAYEHNHDIRFNRITAEWVQGFYLFLDRQALSSATKSHYLNRLKTCLNRACKDGIITVSPAANIDNFRTVDSVRMYLTVDELRMLASVPCRIENIGKAFLFSCLTGLRRSDVRRIRWGDIHRQGEFTRIFFRQKKTQGQEYLDITQEAAQLMGEHSKAESYVFNGITDIHRSNKIIREWVHQAGIKKDITFHCARHTFAVMMLDIGTDLYTVSKLLGHVRLHNISRRNFGNEAMMHDVS